MKQRDQNILKNYQREIDLKTKVIISKKKKKPKHKEQLWKALIDFNQ